MRKSVLIVSLALLAACAAPIKSTDSVALSVSQFVVYANGAGVLGTVNNSERVLTAVVPHTADLADIRPAITHNGMAIIPPDDEPTDFSQPVIYAITGTDGTVREYTAIVTKQTAPNSITGFRFDGLDGAVGAIDEAQGTIAVLVPHGTNPNGLTPTINISGASVVPASGVAQNFGQPVAYTVTGADGLTRLYTVTVTVDPLANTKDITAFGFDTSNGNPQMFVVTNVGTDIFVATVGGDVKTFVPIIVHNGQSVSPPSGVPRNFTNPVTFTVTAENGTTKAWTVTVLAHP